MSNLIAHARTSAAKRRIKRAVEKQSWRDDWGIACMSCDTVVTLILAERARLKGMVKRLLPDRGECAAYQNGYREANADVLNLWNEDKEGKP